MIIQVFTEQLSVRQLVILPKKYVYMKRCENQPLADHFIRNTLFDQITNYFNVQKMGTVYVSRCDKWFDYI